MLGDRHEEEATSLMGQISQNNNLVIISTLVMLEIIEVIRKRITEKERFVGLTSTAKRGIKQKIDDKIREFIDKVTKLERSGKAILVDSQKSTRKFLQKTLSLSLSNFGEINEFSYCFICNRRTSTRYRYRGIGFYDLQHALNAKECAADEIMSFDKGFYQLQNMNDFDSLTITVL